MQIANCKSSPPNRKDWFAHNASQRQRPHEIHHQTCMYRLFAYCSFTITLSEIIVALFAFYSLSNATDISKYNVIKWQYMLILKSFYFRMLITNTVLKSVSVYKTKGNFAFSFMPWEYCLRFYLLQNSYFLATSTHLTA